MFISQNISLGVDRVNIKLQDVNVIISETSRYNGGKYDTVRVETLLVTDEPIPNEETWYVPKGVSIPPEVAAFFKVTDLDMSPKHSSTILQGVEDLPAQAENENLPEVMTDVSRYLLRAVMKKTPLTPIENAQNAYILSYDYKLFPNEDANDFSFKIQVPFDTLKMPNGSVVTLTVLTPKGAKVNPEKTEGKAEDGQTINEFIANIGNVNRQVVSFSYPRDPLFTISYNY